ncbi:hypothetical protein AMTRI_Chr04g246230 [Amborella trichopoda]|uniref:BHLH domain-containing protein n=1 Tax=Amborella trichopoda TaxID=13333 RepID=W1NIT0_AMBTC|nr:transcription factor bHLH96 [Amborella trichopoda]ERM95366.1 hypothetical protein AMTR_s00008p00198780 [Amborella trichopoda]|eukprot:XP_006827950.1 transcription factor bHLH96 [Amborella trichopoda]
MALEAVAFPHNFFNYGCKELYSLVEALEKEEIDTITTEEDQVQWDASSSSEPKAAAVARRKRRRSRSCKNKEEVENQRMTHIAIERNRRKQMNEYLSVLRSLMPESYIQKGDQASIVGGAIDFVKELEQLVQTLEAQKRIKERRECPRPFGDLFALPRHPQPSLECAFGDVEVTMADSHATLKVLSRRRPRQLLKLVAAFHNLRLTILHLNITTVDQMVLYSFSVKVEEECRITSVDEIASAVYEILGKIHEEASLS